jgi:hypothetical protein
MYSDCGLQKRKEIGRKMKEKTRESGDMYQDQ